MAMNPVPSAARNPGPSWGYGFLWWADRWWPRWIFRPALMAGTWLGLAFMPVQRGHSRAYLSAVWGRAPNRREVWRHFFAFAEFLVVMLRAGRGAPLRAALEAENAAGFEALVASERPALFGTFHFGSSDLLGYLLGGRGRRVSMVRLRVDNSDETRLLGRRFAEQVKFLWINDAAQLIFGLKAALDAGESLALKCDRLEFSAKAEPFQFLGAARLFPFTIYHLAILFDRPVVFCLALPGRSAGELQVFASPVFAPEGAAGRAANLRAARSHFQGVLAHLETLVRQHPFLWFNYGPLNPVVPPTGR
jgi:predicted LPLAT superfamily acyltransferase